MTNTAFQLTRLAPLPGSRCALGGAPTSFVEELAMLRDMPRKRAPEITFGQVLAKQTRAQAVAKAMAAMDKALTASLPSPTKAAPSPALVREVGELSAICPCSICAQIREDAQKRIAQRERRNDDLWNAVLGGRTLLGILEEQFARGGIARDVQPLCVHTVNGDAVYVATVQGPSVAELGLDPNKVSGVVVPPGIMSAREAREMVLREVALTPPKLTLAQAADAVSMWEQATPKRATGKSSELWPSVASAYPLLVRHDPMDVVKVNTLT